MEKNFDISSINHLLVIVPHQDDEILIGAGLIYQLLKQKKKVTVAIVTNGDYECNDFSKGRMRLRETLAGLEVLGLSKENVFFLGYADTGMPREESFLTALFHAEEGEKVFPSSTSSLTYGLEDKEDFHYLCFGEHGTYSRNTLMNDLQELIKRRSPDVILTTHPLDMHGDHEALFYFVKSVLEDKNVFSDIRVFGGMVHSPEGDETWPLRDSLCFTCPKGMEESWEERLVLPLGANFIGGKIDGNLKYEALKKYETALEPNAVDYLMAFMKDEEIFWEL